MIAEIVGAVAIVLVAIIEARAMVESSRHKKNYKKAEKRAAQRAEESRLSMAMSFASLQLSIVCANALTGGHNNGNVKEAKAAAQHAEDEYRAYLQRLAATELSKV